MKIRKMELKNHPILGNLNLNFCDESDKTIDTIIIAGENGTGKSSLLNVLYEFSYMSYKLKDYRRFEVEISNGEKDILMNNPNQKNIFKDGILNNRLEFIFDKINKADNNWEGCIGYFLDENNQKLSFPPWIFTTEIDLRKITVSIFSDVEINYTPKSISGVTSKNIDEEIIVSTKSTENLATEITQLLIDIQSLDDGELGNWVRSNPNHSPPENVIDIRTKRFKKAFELMFDKKKYTGISNKNNKKNVEFEENKKVMTIENLSSGEKQIVFRGSFCLKNKESTKGAFVLIDEPEISLHPQWQIKILDFYKELFKDENGMQTSQLFVVTHSPFIIHNESRKNDKVIIMSKNEQGHIEIEEEGQFYGWNSGEVVKKAFNIGSIYPSLNDDKNLIITEGKTDWKHIKRAFEKLGKSGNFEFLEYENEIEMGDKNLLQFCQQVSKLERKHKIICVFDRDNNDILKVHSGSESKNWGNNVHSILIPIPKHRKNTPFISIEHYYSDSEIKTIDKEGRRLYIGNEFSKKSTTSKCGMFFCIEKDKLGDESIKIIDLNVFRIDDENKNIAMTKNNFSNYILNDDEHFKNHSYKEFEKIFIEIENIIND